MDPILVTLLAVMTVIGIFATFGGLVLFVDWYRQHRPQLPRYTQSAQHRRVSAAWSLTMYQVDVLIRAPPAAVLSRGYSAYRTSRDEEALERLVRIPSPAHTIHASLARYFLRCVLFHSTCFLLLSSLHHLHALNLALYIPGNSLYNYYQYCICLWH
ncbi:hypothetical protein FB45DRAFT_297920 [Roridomyces roridus]|uniref:Uncharacterized protein n=1 Tax=Roridomyces roridus TaxID=1738132 RepID=A0AAD7FV05_9AGAR|nr:hypothetical protein FB45DRAFT_297920 [Roridomyces roridus]